MTPLEQIETLFDSVYVDETATEEQVLSRALELLKQIPRGIAPDRLKAEGLIRTLLDVVEARAALAEFDTAERAQPAPGAPAA